MDDEAFQRAAEKIRTIVGADGFDAGDRTRAHYARSTSLWPSLPLAVVFPTSTQQVQGLVRVAAAFGFPIHAISRGRNWGYGDATAPTDGQLILDLSRMNQIVEVNAELAYAVIEPGVTQGQLFTFLRDRDIPLWLDCTGAGREASLLGNALERGFGHTPYSDHFASLSGMEVVLGDGRVLETGLAHYESARARYLYPYGVGPSLDGLFAQSNFGIVTRAGLWLMPRPEAFRAFFVRAEHDEDLEPLVRCLSLMRRRGILRSAVHIGNDLRVLASRLTYPWERAEYETPLPDVLRKQLRHELHIGAWNVAGGVYGDRRMVRASKRTIQNMLRPYRVVWIDNRKMRIARWLSSRLERRGRGQRLRNLLASVEPAYALMTGEPVDEPLRGAAWRVRGETPTEPVDPRDISAGLLWASPVLPATSGAAREVVRILEPIYEKHRFEPLLTFTLVNERAMVCISSISFDIREVEESARAKSCYAELNSTLVTAGFIPYRTGPLGYEHLVDRSGVFWSLANQIKKVLDPSGIISPGRYL